MSAEFLDMYSHLWTVDIDRYALIRGSHPLDPLKEWYTIYNTEDSTLLVIEDDAELRSVVDRMLSAGVRVLTELPPSQHS